MKRFVDGVDRTQALLLPDRLEDYVHQDNPVRLVDAFVEALDLASLGFDAASRAAGGRPAYHPGALLKIYTYGYLNLVQSSRRLEREAQRNLEVIWLTGRLAPDFKTIADFRKDNGAAIVAVCSRFTALCRRMKVFSHAVVAIDGSKFKAVNSRDRNFTVGKIKARRSQLDESVARYLAEMDRADRDPAQLPEARIPQLRDKLAKVREQMAALDRIEQELQEAPDSQISETSKTLETSGVFCGLRFLGSGLELSGDKADSPTGPPARLPDRGAVRTRHDAAGVPTPKARPVSAGRRAKPWGLATCHTRSWISRRAVSARPVPGRARFRTRPHARRSGHRPGGRPGGTPWREACDRR